MSNNNARPPITENGTLQTWLPYPNYAESAHVLDNKRLSKQRTNVLEILDVLHEVNQQSKYYEHPVIEMWRGYEPQLCEYGLVVCEEYRSRGRLEKCGSRISWHLDCATCLPGLGILASTSRIGQRCYGKTLTITGGSSVAFPTTCP